MEIKTTGNFTKVIIDGLIKGSNQIQKQVLSSMLEELQKDNFLDKLNKKWLPLDEIEDFIIEKYHNCKNNLNISTMMNVITWFQDLKDDE